MGQFAGQQPEGGPAHVEQIPDEPVLDIREAGSASAANQLPRPPEQDGVFDFDGPVDTDRRVRCVPTDTAWS